MRPPPPLPSPKPDLPPEDSKGPQTGSFALPIAGRWFPSPAMVVMLASLAAGTLSLLEILEADVVTTKHAAIAFAKGAVGWFVTYVGLRSAGPRNQQ